MKPKNHFNYACSTESFRLRRSGSRNGTGDRVEPVPPKEEAGREDGGGGIYEDRTDPQMRLEERIRPRCSR